MDFGPKIGIISIWRASADSLSVAVGGMHTISNPSFKFQESADFSRNGKITLIGNVMEWDKDTVDDRLGNYNADVISVANILNKPFTKTYPGDKGRDKAYVELTMTIVALET